MALGAGQAVLVQSVQIRVRIKLFHSVHALGGPLAGQQHQRTAHGGHAGGVADGLRADLLVALLEEGFVEFFENIKGDEAKELKGEYLLPIYIDELLKKGKVSVRLLETQDKWFGVTYKEDKPVVVESFAKLIADGVYQKDLFADLKA